MLTFREDKAKNEDNLRRLYSTYDFMGVFNNEDVVFGRMKAGENLTTHVYHEPNFQNNSANELHPIFTLLAIIAGVLFLVSLCGLDYRGVMLLGEFL